MRAGVGATNARSTLVRYLARLLAILLFGFAAAVGFLGGSALVGFVMGKTMHGDGMLAILLVPGYLLAKWGVELWRSTRSVRG
jgi:hypothetical protein